MTTNKDVYIDFTPFLVEALVSNKKIEDDINKLYEKNKFRAYELAKNSEYYNHVILCDGGIKREINAKRALGLLLLSQEDESIAKEIMKLFKKGWKGIYRYIETRDYIDFKELLETYAHSDMFDDVFNSYVTVGIFIAYELDKEMGPTDFISYAINSMQMRIKHYQSDYRFSYESLKKDKDLFEKAISIKNRFYETYGQIKYFHELYSPFIKKNYPDMLHFTDTVSLIFDSENVMLESMLDNDYKFLEKDIIELAAIYYMLYKNQNRENSAKFIIFGLYLKYTIKSYKSIKDYYFENNKETLYYELQNYDKKINELENENKALRAKMSYLESENQRLKKEYKESIEKENILLKRENEKFRNIINELEKDKKELLVLRESLFNRDNEEKIEEVTEKIDIPNIDAIVVGGHSNWHEKLKEVLPSSFKYIEGDDEAFDINILNNVTHVFIYNKYMSHGFYYKLINKLRNTNINFYFINFTSPEYVKKEIYKSLKLDNC